MKRPMSWYKDQYLGCPAAVLGGGPSLPGDLLRLPTDCLLIAVNYHAMLLCKPDFMVFNDLPSTDDVLEAAVKNFSGVHVTQHREYSDVLLDVPVWLGNVSSNFAAWFACWMGCEPVILCGMDCYQGDQVYFHDYVDKPHFHYGLDHHIRPWKEDAKNLLPHPERVRAASGPLVSIFGLYEEER
jgi:hypothetical protein